MSKIFARRFPKPWMEILKARPQWWLDVLDQRFKDETGAEQALFLAVRNGYLNAYVEGQSIFQMRFNGEALKAKIHHKYVHEGAEGQKQIVFDGKAVDGVPYTGAAMMSRWVDRAQTYAKYEKKGVGVIVSRNSHVIDVEMALPGKRVPRIDMVALEAAGSIINIVFYEAKRFGDGDLRSNTLRPKVMNQIDSYEVWLREEDQEKRVIEAYRETCRLLMELRTMQGSTAIHDLIIEASKDSSKLRVDPKVRLIIFGYDEAKLNDRWKKHEDVLRDRLGNRGLIMHPSPEKVELPVQSPVPTATNSLAR